MNTITKKDFVQRIAEETGVSKVEVTNVVQAFLDLVIDELAKGNRLEFRGFGVFEVKLRKRRQAQNPKTLEKVVVPERMVVKFKEGKLLKQKLESQSLSRTREANN